MFGCADMHKRLVFVCDRGVFRGRRSHVRNNGNWLAGISIDTVLEGDICCYLGGRKWDNTSPIAVYFCSMMSVKKNLLFFSDGGGEKGMDGCEGASELK